MEEVEGKYSSPKINRALIYAFIFFLIFDLFAYGIFYSAKRLKTKTQEMQITQNKQNEQKEVGEVKVDTVLYKEYLEKYPNNTSPVTNYSFTITGEIGDVSDGFFIIKVNGETIRIKYRPESHIFIVSENHSWKEIPFTPQSLKIGDREKLLVSELENKELVLVAILRNERK